MRITADTNADALGQRISNVIARQIPFATANALTQTAHKVRDAEKAEMARVFDRPTRFTLDAFQVVPARKDTLVAEVRQKEIAAGRHYLPVEVKGGGRPSTGFESVLRGLSPVPFGAAIPARAAKRDAHGNWSGSERNRVLAALRTQGPVRGNGMMRSGRATEYYLGQRGDLTGIFRRRGDDDDLIVLLTKDAATYRPLFDFYGVAHRTFAAVYEPLFAAAMEKALTSAR